MIEHNRGDTFDYSGQVILRVLGTRQLDLTGWTGRSMVRDKFNRLVDELTFSWIDATDSTMRVRSADTSAWPVGRVRMDVQLTSPEGDVVSSTLDTINVKQDVTFDG